MISKNHGKCDRCGQPTPNYIMSIFNTDMCCDSCIEKEKAHADYQKARDTELKEVQKGNYNYPGIGLPADLKV